MSTPAAYDPWKDLASRPDITYGRTELPGGAGGMWFPDLRAIAIDRRLPRVGARCVLAHELAHVDLNHQQCVGYGPDSLRLARRREHEATRLAARRLLPVTLIAAKYVEDIPLPDLAADLAVTEAMLHIRLGTLTNEERTALPINLREVRRMT